MVSVSKIVLLWLYEPRKCDRICDPNRHILYQVELTHCIELGKFCAICVGFWLQNPADKREIFCDEKLKQIFDGKDKVGFLEITKLLSPHFVKTA